MRTARGLLPPPTNQSDCFQQKTMTSPKDQDAFVVWQPSPPAQNIFVLASPILRARDIQYPAQCKIPANNP